METLHVGETGFRGIGYGVDVDLGNSGGVGGHSEGHRGFRESQIDDVITCDPGEAYEISAQTFLSSVYDRLMRYEAEDMTKLVGGVAESWMVSPDAKTYTFKLRPNQKFESGAPVTADDMAFSLQRVVIMNKTPGFLFTQLGWNKDNVRDLVTAPDAHTLQLQIIEDFAPTLVLSLMATVAASVVEKKVAMANEANGDLGNTWLKTHSADIGRLQAGVVETQRVRNAGGQSRLPSGLGKDEAGDHSPRARTGIAATAAGKRRHRHRAQPAARPVQVSVRQ